jgi:hypothetical protein
MTLAFLTCQRCNQAQLDKPPWQRPVLPPDSSFAIDS